MRTLFLKSEASGLVYETRVVQFLKSRLENVFIFCNQFVSWCRYILGGANGFLIAIAVILYVDLYYFLFINEQLLIASCMIVVLLVAVLKFSSGMSNSLAQEIVNSAEYVYYAALEYTNVLLFGYLALDKIVQMLYGVSKLLVFVYKNILEITSASLQLLAGLIRYWHVYRLLVVGLLEEVLVTLRVLDRVILAAFGAFKLSTSMDAVVNSTALNLLYGGTVFFRLVELFLLFGAQRGALGSASIQLKFVDGATALITNVSNFRLFSSNKVVQSAASVIPSFTYLCNASLLTTMDQEKKSKCPINASYLDMYVLSFLMCVC